jgi:hypothetical protein
MRICQAPGCGKELPPARGNRERLWCDEWSRKRAGALVSRNGHVAAPLPPGPVESSVRAVLGEEPLAGVEGAYAQLAIATAAMVDGGSVPAVAQLRSILEVLAGRVDEAAAAFLKSVQTPEDWGLGWTVTTRTRCTTSRGPRARPRPPGHVRPSPLSLAVTSSGMALPPWPGS